MQPVLASALYPSVIAILFSIPALVIVRLVPPLVNRVFVVPATAICSALPPIIITALSDFPQWSYAMRPLASCFLAGALGGLGYLAFRGDAQTSRTARMAFWASSALVFLPILGWLAAWRVPSPPTLMRGSTWETASPAECALIQRSIREMKFDRLAGRPPLIGERRSGGPCDWSATGLPLERLTISEFSAAAGDHLTGRYIDHIGASRPSYSLLRLRAVVQVSHSYGSLGGDGFDCTFRRSFTGWKFISCERAWIA